VMISSVESFESESLKLQVAFVMSERELEEKELQRADGIDTLKVVRYRSDNQPLGGTFLGSLIGLPSTH
jgi:hypothetical protein